MKHRLVYGSLAVVLMGCIAVLLGHWEQQPQLWNVGCITGILFCMAALLFCLLKLDMMEFEPDSVMGRLHHRIQHMGVAPATPCRRRQVQHFLEQQHYTRDLAS